MSDKSFDGIDALVKDIDANYQGAEVGNRYDGKYRVVSVGEVTAEFIVERAKSIVERCLTTRKKTELVYLKLEETDG